jgi:hypothetical protein
MRPVRRDANWHTCGLDFAKCAIAHPNQAGSRFRRNGRDRRLAGQCDQSASRILSIPTVPATDLSTSGFNGRSLDDLPNIEPRSIMRELRHWSLNSSDPPKEPVLSVENDNFQSKSCADKLKALSEPLRLRIIDLLRHGEMTVGDIAEFLETELVTVSHHLKILKHADLVEVERDGRFMVYRLKNDLLQKGTAPSKQFLNLGCCRIEVPDKKSE